ncbi:hypothetical protein ABZ756_15845 [Mammaliicoccus sciuri]
MGGTFDNADFDLLACFEYVGHLWLIGKEWVGGSGFHRCILLGPEGPAGLPFWGGWTAFGLSGGERVVSVWGIDRTLRTTQWTRASYSSPLWVVIDTN